MKLSSIFVLLTLIVIVKSAWWAAAVQPVILGFGTVLTALNQDVLNVELSELKSWLPFINKSEETKSDAKGEEKKQEEE